MLGLQGILDVIEEERKDLLDMIQFVHNHIKLLLVGIRNFVL